MTVKELETIQNAATTAWEQLCENRWIILNNSGLPRGCGYKAAYEYFDGKDTRELSAWIALDNLTNSLGISIPVSDYAAAFNRNIYRYAENK